MHFFREGLDKLRNPKPFSAGFFGNAKGPFTDAFVNRVWDRDGLNRLDRTATEKAWEHFRVQVETHFGFDAKQKQAAEKVQKRTEEQLKEHFEANADDIDEYLKNVARRDRYRADRQRMETPSLRDQVDKIEGEIRAKRTKLLAPIDLMWQGYARDLNSIATNEQRSSRGLLELSKPGRRFLDSEGIDSMIPWFDATIGVLLIIGLATRPAALIAAAFLFSVIASQWPTASGSIATWPQFIEALGLLVVAAAGAGRFAGVDGICYAVCCGRCSSTKQGIASPGATAEASRSKKVTT
jgi:hypothetical protein